MRLLRRFLRQRGGVVGAVIVLVVLTVAVLAPVMRGRGSWSGG